MSRCVECPEPHDTTIPKPLCKRHAIAYYQGLVRVGSALHQLSELVGPPPDDSLRLTVVEEMHRDWVKQNYSDDEPVRREHLARCSVLRKFEKRVLIDALAQCHWRQDQAALMLGLTARGIWWKIQSHDITPPPPLTWGSKARNRQRKEVLPWHDSPSRSH